MVLLPVSSYLKLNLGDVDQSLHVLPPLPLLVPHANSVGRVARLPFTQK